GKRYEPDAQRTESVRVAQGDQLVGCDDTTRVGADHSRERAADHLFPSAAVRVLDETRHHLRVKRRLEDGALLLELAAQSLGVQKVSVVSNGTGAKLRVIERKGMCVFGAACAGRRVAGVSKRQQRALAQVVHRRR